MHQICSITVRVVSILLVLLIFVLGRIPDAAYAVAAPPAAVPHTAVPVMPDDDDDAVITAYHHQGPEKNRHSQPVASKERQHSRRLHHSKNFQLKLSGPEEVLTIRAAYEPASAFKPVIPQAYSYLFFREINPPPPKTV